MNSIHIANDFQIRILLMKTSGCLVYVAVGECQFAKLLFLDGPWGHFKNLLLAI